MIVRPFDPALALVVGMAVGVLVRFRLAARNEDWYPALLALALGVLWGTLALAGSGSLAVLPAVETTPAVAVGYALAYPFWLRLGAHVVFLFVGRRPAEGGLLWIYVIDDYTADFEESWD